MCGPVWDALEPRGRGGLWGAKLDITSCYWCIRLPRELEGSIKVTAGDRTHTLPRVPFGWHQAPDPVQALITDLLRDIGPQGVVVVQYLDDVLFVGLDRDQVALVAQNAACALRQAGFLVSDKLELDPQRNVT